MNEPDARPNGLSCVNAVRRSTWAPIDDVRQCVVASLVLNRQPVVVGLMASNV